MLSELAKNILTTIVYYDVLDYSLTIFELEKYLMRAEEKRLGTEEKLGLTQIMPVLESEELKNLIEECQGFYFLQGRQDLVAQRIERNKISEKKLKIIFRLAKWLRFVPYLRMIAVTGRLAMKNSEKGSDIDVLVAIQKGRMFTGRLLLTLVVHLFGQRRYGKKIADRVCLNYFVTDNALEIKLKDLFSASEYFFALPVYNAEIFQNFQKANSWIADYKANYFPDEIPGVRTVEDSSFSRFFQKLGEGLLSFDWIEKGLKKWQLQRIAENPKTYQEGSLI